MIELKDQLIELAQLNPSLCEKTFLDSVFDLIWEDKKITVSFLNQNPERLYLINAVIEADCRQRDWTLSLDYCSDLDKWDCCIATEYDDYDNEFKSSCFPERYLALLDAYLQALRAEAENGQEI